MFPNSHACVLSINEVRTLHPHAVWRARNEIYLRRGFHFATPEWQHFTQEFGSAYQPRTASVEAVQKQLSCRDCQSATNREPRAGSELRAGFAVAVRLAILRHVAILSSCRNPHIHLGNDGFSGHLDVSSDGCSASSVGRWSRLLSRSCWLQFSQLFSTRIANGL